MNEEINPFLYGRPLDSQEGLVGRDAALEEILGCTLGTGDDGVRPPEERMNGG
jgi:hypothetical protein